MALKKLTKKQQETWTILSTPDDIDFKKFREEHDDFWLTKEREVLWISSMTSSHIVQCMNMLERLEQDNTKAYKGLTNELKRRYHNSKTEWTGI